MSPRRSSDSLSIGQLVVSKKSRPPDFLRAADGPEKRFAISCLLLGLYSLRPRCAGRCQNIVSLVFSQVAVVAEIVAERAEYRYAFVRAFDLHGRSAAFDCPHDRLDLCSFNAEFHDRSGDATLHDAIDDAGCLQHTGVVKGSINLRQVPALNRRLCAVLDGIQIDVISACCGHLLRRGELLIGRWREHNNRACPQSPSGTGRRHLKRSRHQMPAPLLTAAN